jgi:site-specific DNA recombinase
MKAAMYLRSSKDRSDVSLAAQRHELQKVADSRSLTVVQSYEDAVESGSTEDRPGFIELVRALKNPNRGWDNLLVYDTSRIARRRYIAQAIKHEAKKRGVVILYARMPADLDPVAELVLESVFEAMDEAHSLMSREKGLAGMAQNVRQGWRAGGRAPIGYRLESHPTGAIREGKPVTKTKLVPDEYAPAVRGYLKARAAGVPRVQAMAESRLDKSPSTMVCVEWNALAYAGHTVWNRHAPEGARVKRRAREDWQITRGTHEAFITEAEAEAILSQLETSDIGRAVARAKASQSPALLTGLLFTSEGRAWVAHGKHYRLRPPKGAERGKLVLAEKIDRAVMAQVEADMNSELFLKALLEAGKRHKVASDPAAALDAKIGQLEREKAKAAQLALTSEADTFLKLVEERGRQIDALRREAAAIRSEATLTEHTGKLTPEQLRERLAEQGPARAIQTLVERIVLEPDLTCRLQYKALSYREQWRSMASPKGFDRWPQDLEATLIVCA